MKTCWFVVIKANGLWWVDCEGHAYGPMNDKGEAIQYARKIAETYGDPKRQSEVWVHDNAGRPVQIWSATSGTKAG